MKLLDCPLNGLRNIEEFQYLGPVRRRLAEDAASDREWTAYLFRAENRPGIIVEWWRHTASNHVFMAERNLVTNEVIRTFDPVETGTKR
jgi:sarcosine oxidase, subunit delta